MQNIKLYFNSKFVNVKIDNFCSIKKKLVSPGFNFMKLICLPYTYMKIANRNLDKGCTILKLQQAGNH